MASARSPALALACLAALALAAPAGAATVSRLRVGQHPGFTRVVFELDSAAGYRIERSNSADGTPIVLVTISASVAPSAPRAVRSPSSLLESVSLEQPQDRAVATVRLRRTGLPIKEMILRGPPRIVLDVLGDDTALAARAGPPQPSPPRPGGEEPERPVARAEPPRPAPTPAPAPIARAQPEPPPEKPAPQTAKPAPATPKPAPAVEKPAPAAEKPAAAAERPAPAVEKPAPDAQPETAEAPQTPAERAAQEAMDRRLAAVREAAEQRKRQLEEERRSRETEEQRQRSEAEAERAREQAAAPAEDEGGPSAVLIGGVAGALLLVVLVAVVLSRRRALPRDLDVDAFEGTGEEAGPFDDEEHAEDVESSAPTKREPLFAPDDRAAEPLSMPGLFDEPEKGESGMETRVQDLQIGRRGPGVAPPPGPDLSNALADLERRMSALESKLQEANAARERLERQVAAQSEELRVQRAAIARTQRALRGLSRSEEEQATEPALRD